MVIGIIEDDKLLRKALDTSLKNQGYTTILAASRKEAIKNIDSSVDLLIVDIGLPDGDGINLYQELQKNGKIPAIFLTAKDDEKRLIHVTVSRQKAFLILKFENYCEEKLQYQDGNIATTKKDKKYHGYGMKSIRYTVNKYGGAVTIDTKENWFDLKILIPIKEEQGD